MDWELLSIKKSDIYYQFCCLHLSRLRIDTIIVNHIDIVPLLWNAFLHLMSLSPFLNASF